MAKACIAVLFLLLYCSKCSDPATYDLNTTYHFLYHSHQHAPVHRHYHVPVLFITLLNQKTKIAYGPWFFEQPIAGLSNFNEMLWSYVIAKKRVLIRLPHSSIAGISNANDVLIECIGTLSPMNKEEASSAFALFNSIEKLSLSSAPSSAMRSSQLLYGASPGDPLLAQHEFQVIANDSLDLDVSLQQPKNQTEIASVAFGHVLDKQEAQKEIQGPCSGQTRALVLDKQGPNIKRKELAAQKGEEAQAPLNFWIFM